MLGAVWLCRHPAVDESTGRES